MRTVLGDTMPGWFTGLTYKDPERFTPDEARERRLQSALDRVQRERDRLEATGVSLSRGSNLVHYNRLKAFEAQRGEELEALRGRARALSLRDPEQRSPTTKRTLSRFFQLLQQRSALQQRASAERRMKQFQASAVDRRFYNPTKGSPRTIFNTASWLRVTADAVTRHVFKSPNISIPCIQRNIRKQVLFAKGHGGHGHRSRKRKGPFSYIGC